MILRRLIRLNTTCLQLRNKIFLVLTAFRKKYYCVSDQVTSYVLFLLQAELET